LKTDQKDVEKYTLWGVGYKNTDLSTMFNIEETQLDTSFEVMQITRVSKNIDTNGTSGYLGLAPPESEESEKISFLHQMGRKGIIDMDKLGFSFHYAKDSSGESYIRLGGISSKVEKSLNFVDTLDNSWRINADIYFIGGLDIFDGVNR
jgi:hypothetical protein